MDRLHIIHTTASTVIYDHRVRDAINDFVKALDAIPMSRDQNDKLVTKFLTTLAWVSLVASGAPAEPANHEESAPCD